jgi:hypothetical protein
LGDTAPTRLRIYKLVKDAYDIRSLAVHGASEKRTKAERRLANTPAFDNLVRSIISALLCWPQAVPYLMVPNPNLEPYDALLHGLCVGVRDGVPETDVHGFLDGMEADSNPTPPTSTKRDAP